MEEGDVVEITPPVDWSSKPKSKKRKEVFCPDIIDVDDYEDFYVSVLDSGKSDPRFKGKVTGESYKGSQYSKEAFYNDLIYVDDDDLMEYALLQSHLDDFDVPPGIEVSIPRVTNVNGNSMTSFTGSVNKPAVSGSVQLSSSNYLGRKRGPPKAYGIHANSDSGKKPLQPHVHVLHNIQQNQTSTAYNTFSKASMPLAPHEQHLHSLQNQISTAANNFPKASMPTGKVSSSLGPSSSKSVNENSDVNLKKLDLFKKFDTVEDCSDHSFSESNAFEMNRPSRSWAKKIQDEWRILENDLPDTIFVRVYESRMDLLRAAIIGAEGTPYHDGLFFFDMFFPSDYPNVPPQVNYHSGGLCINPNLYDCGYVCLSLLDTWDGSGKEMWIPGESTILQVLVSIQGLILNEKPYFNEPGYELESGTVEGEEYSLDYNEKTLIYSLKTMVYSIRKPPKHFEDLVVGHFSKRAHDILVACRAYKNGSQVGSVVVKGDVESVNNKGKKGNSKLSRKKEKGNSQSFKNELAGALKTLVKAFAQVGVKDCDRFLY